MHRCGEVDLSFLSFFLVLVGGEEVECGVGWGYAHFAVLRAGRWMIEAGWV